MSIQAVIPVGMSDQVSLDQNGVFAFPQRVKERIGWTVPSRVKVNILIDKQCQEVPLTIFFSTDGGAEKSFSLSPLYRNKSGGTGAKVTCARLTNQVIAARVALPKSQITPIYPVSNLCDVVLLLSEPTWKEVEFTMTGVQSVPNDRLGVYQIVGDDDKAVKIGQGVLSARLGQHLKDDRAIRIGKYLRYFLVTDKRDCVVLEQVFIAQHENVYGILPEINRIRA